MYLKFSYQIILQTRLLEKLKKFKNLLSRKKVFLKILVFKKV